MRACWAATLLVLVQPSPASCATCRGTSVVSRVLALTHQHLRKSPSVRQPFAEISGSISFSPPVFPFPEPVPNFCVSLQGFPPPCLVNGAGRNKKSSQVAASLYVAHFSTTFIVLN